MKKFKLIQILLALLIAVAVLSCEEDEGTTPEEEEEEQEMTAPESWVMVEADTFFVASARPLPGSASPYRYQINFATRDQLSQTNNDGETESTFAIGFAFETKPETTGTFTFTSDRFNIGANELNLYQSFFVNTGHSRADQNYLSTDDVNVNIEIVDGQLTSDLASLTMFQEGNESETFELQWSLNLNW